MNMEKEQNFISAVVYVRNNARTLPAFLQSVYAQLDSLFTQFEIICVNDASEDASEDVIREQVKRFSCPVTIVNMGYVQGAELSMNAGEDLAIGDFVFEFETAQLFWPEDMVTQVYRKMQEGYDIISACPEGKTRLSSRLFYSTFNRYSNVRGKLRTEAFRLVSRRAINRAAAMTNVQMYKKAVHANTGLKQTFLTFEPQEEMLKAKGAGKERRALAWDSLILFTDIGYKIALVMSAIMLLFAAVVGIYVVIVYATGHPVEGWTPIMVFLAIGFFVLFAILTIVIKYLSLILHLQFRRQKYIVEGIEKL